MTKPSSPATEQSSQDEWYQRERAAFIAWWEAEGQKQFSETPTLAAGAGWLARADAMKAVPEIADAEKSRAFEWLRGLAISESSEPVTARLAGVALAEWHACKAAIPSATPNTPKVPREEVTHMVGRLRAYNPVEGQEGLRVRDMLLKEAALMIEDIYGSGGIGR